MDRLPDNCTIDCPFCVEKVINNEEVPFCPVVDEFIYEYTDGTPDYCPLIEDDVSDKQDSDKKE